MQNRQIDFRFRGFGFDFGHFYIVQLSKNQFVRKKIRQKIAR
jgi:hypothetical protein